MKKFIALLLTLLLALSAAAPALAEKQTYRSLYSGEVTTLNYLTTTTTSEFGLLSNLIDTLVESDRYGQLQPCLAESWEASADGLTWTFRLRHGVQWVDAQGNAVAEVTAHDFVTAAEYILNAQHASGSAKTLYKIIVGAKEYYDGTATPKEGEQPAPKTEWDTVGVKALNDYTLQYTLKNPVAYFLSMVDNQAFMPVYGPFLTEKGEQFGLATGNDTLLYCGAFILSTYEPQQQRVLTKNPTYWDKDNVFLDAIQMTYNAEASSIATTMYQSGEVDQADISSDLLSAMMADPNTKDLIHPSRADTSYAYWYLFNFDPNFDAEYEPENWKLAVNNENFRKSIVHAFNRMPALATSDRIDPESLKNNTITPNAFASASKDYTYYEGLAAYTDGDNFDEALAEEYKTTAIEELTAAGATFPVKMLMCYNPTSANWAQECQVVEQQIENVLGADYVDIIIQAGPETGFLGAIRRTGNYAFMKCNWGADYADPETWTDPFSTDSSYSFIFKSTDPETQALYAEYTELVAAAKAITDDMDARYAAFAKAEAFLLDHAFAVPFSISNRSYQMCNLNVFEGQYASFGLANQRYKDQHLYSSSMGMEEYQAAYAEWQSKKAG